MAPLQFMNVTRSDTVESDALEASNVVVEALQLVTHAPGLARMELLILNLHYVCCADEPGSGLQARPARSLRQSHARRYECDLPHFGHCRIQ